MKRLTVLCCLYLLCACQEEAREPKFLFGKKPFTVINYRQISEVITEFIPSSCFVIEPTLPPCRHVRNLEIHPSAPTRITRTKSPNFQNIQGNTGEHMRNPSTLQPSESNHRVPTPPMRVRPQIIRTHHYWGWNLFSPFRVQNVTHTMTKTQYVTTILEDPHTVVSFHIKGCRPSRLPFNLSECNRPEIVLQEEKKNIVVMAPLKFIPILEKTVTPVQETDRQGERGEEKQKTFQEETKHLDNKPTESMLSQTETEANTTTEAFIETKSDENESTPAYVGDLEALDNI